MLAHYTKHTTSVFSVYVCSLCAYGFVGDLLIHTHRDTHTQSKVHFDRAYDQPLDGMWQPVYETTLHTCTHIHNLSSFNNCSWWVIQWMHCSNAPRFLAFLALDGCYHSPTVQIYHSLVTRSVSRYALSRLNFFEQKKHRKKWASYIPLSQLGVPHHPAQFILCIHPTLSHSFASLPWRYALNFFDVVFVFFSSKQIEPARCHWARPMCLS